MKKYTSEKAYEKGTTIYDDETREVFKVISCTPLFLMSDGAQGFGLELEEMNTSVSSSNTLRQLEEAVMGVKMHDKDQFMILNIIAQLKDEVNNEEI